MTTYKCPNGHLFEVFHGMTEDGPTACEVCGAHGQPDGFAGQAWPLFYAGKEDLL